MQRKGKRIRTIFLSLVALILSSDLLRGQSVEQDDQAACIGGNYCITVVAVGDIMMGSTYPSNYLPPEDGKELFAGTTELLKKGDIVFGNLEGPLVDNGIPVKCKIKLPQCFEFVTPTRYAFHLKNAGFTVMNIANNHVFDCGIKGVESTIDTLRNAGVEATGGITIARVFIKEKRIAVAGFSFTPSDHAFSIHNIGSAKDIVKKLKEENDIVIVSFHGGGEGKSATRIFNKNEIFLGENRGNVVNFSRSVVDAGADLVLGHGPHVLRAIEIYRNKLIAYSLGNFMAYKLFNVKGPNGLSVILTFRIDTKNGNFIDGNLTPLRLTSDGLPEIDPSGEALPFIRKLTLQDIKNNTLIINDTTGFLSLAQ